MISYRLKLDRSLSSSTNNVFQIEISGISNSTKVEEIFELLKTFPPGSIIPHPLSVSLAHNEQETCYYIVLNAKTHRLFTTANFGQQLEWLRFIGITDKIDRSDALRPAVNYFKFNQKLKKLDIYNPGFDEATPPIRRIHLVLPEYLDDPEISAGLPISQKKNRVDDQVIYVMNYESLMLALARCERYSTLIIDGHWEHKCRNYYGIWENKYSAEIAADIKDFCVKFPEKIQHIRLLGCNSGKLTKPERRLSVINPDRLFFKSKHKSDFEELEASKFRDRAVYLSPDEQHPFAETSLAALIWNEIKDLKIILTAPPSLTYPYPAGAKSAEFNIGSDSETWEMPPSWKRLDTPDLDWQFKLEMLKSISLILEKDFVELKTRPGKWLSIS